MRFDLHKVFKNAGEFLIDAAYPKRCAICGFRGEWVCRVCLETPALFKQPWCSRCGVPILHPCRCYLVPVMIDQLRSAGPYDGWLRQSVHLIKYQGESSRVDHLAEIVRPVLQDIDDPGALVPVPLHKQRIRERGFNQSALLAQALSALSGLELWDGLLRVRDTPHQVGLSASERALNVAGAFEIREMPVGIPKRVVLVDDVFTTGATIEACADVLLRRGAESVSAMTVC